VRAVLVFCEGKHDVIFVERTLGACANCKRMKKPIRELPSPFGAGPGASRGLITQRLAEITVEDLDLQDSYPPTPQFESVVKLTEQDVFVLIRAGGKDSAEAIIELIQRTDDLLSIGIFAVTEYAAAFLFDANDVGLNAAVSAFRNAYASHYGNLDGVAHARLSHPLVFSRN